MRTEPVQWLIVGAGGMLASDMVRRLEESGAFVCALTREQLDITDADAVSRAVNGADVVVNCAAYTAVDAAEDDEATALQINAYGPGLLAAASAAAGARLVHVSTDYVFAGDAREPYAEDAPMNPQGAYGRTKAAGERAVAAARGDHLIVRTAWLYGATGPCFPKTIAKAGAERGSLQVVNDQTGQPTWTQDLADFIIALVDARAPSGIYHGTSAGQATWFEFAREICLSAGLGDIVTPVPTSAYPRPAPRPAWSVLGHEASEALGVASIGDWRDRWREAAPSVLA
jgi:dTDP-4-dehydrorhamnose reductase